MRFYKKVTLKDGRECILRECRSYDAEAVLDTFLKTHAETDYMLSYPDENTFTAASERDYLVEIRDSDDGIEMCAELDGTIVGTAGFSYVGDKDKVKHRAEFGVGIEKAFWGLGIGRALTEACIDCAKEAGYTQLELDVVADNLPAVNLYKSLGFTEFGRNPKGFRSRTAGWQELILMRLELK